MTKVKIFCESLFKYLKSFIKWLVISAVVGIVGGIAGSLFHLSIDYVTNIRVNNSWLIFLLPVGGVLIALIYGFFRKKGNLDTNRVIEAVDKDKKVPLIMTPLIFISTCITHLLGGSAGREGAALQLGGSLGYNIGKVFGLNEKDLHIIVMSGMSAVFAALFGTPVTAAVFAIEVVAIGTIHYSALMPGLISSITAFYVARFGFEISPIVFELAYAETVFDMTLIKVGILSALCALVSIGFCVSIRLCEKYMEKLFPNKYARGAIGGAIIVALTLAATTYDYNGAGMNVISQAVLGTARPEAFLLKILFTAVTIAAGFKGGEIVPTFFIGSTFGCIMGAFLGLDGGFGAAIGIVAMFCGVTNCPLASIFLALELFGGKSILFFAVACVISFALSGYSGLYKSQKIIFSKFSEEHININTR